MRCTVCGESSPAGATPQSTLSALTVAPIPPKQIPSTSDSQMTAIQRQQSVVKVDDR